MGLCDGVANCHACTYNSQLTFDVQLSMNCHSQKTGTRVHDECSHEYIERYMNHNYV